MQLNYQEKSVRVLDNSISPAISLNFNVTLGYYEMPLSLTASLYSEDGKFLSNFTRIDRSSGFNQIKNITAIPEGNFLNMQSQQWVYSYEMVALLPKDVLDYIEEVREKNKKKDVVLIVRAVIEYVTVIVTLGNFGITQTGPSNRTNFVIFLARNQNPNYSLGILTLMGNEPLFSLNKQALPDYKITIPSSDWTNDFQPKLGIGRFMILEIPEIDFDSQKLKEKGEEFKTLIGRITSSKDIVQTMEKYLREGEWGQVVAESRKFLELFTKGVKSPIKDLVQDSTGLPEESINKLTAAFDNLKDYANALHHSVTRDSSGQSLPTKVFTGGKEDAYLVFNLCVSILNLVSKKLAKSLS
ncbi:MAG: hypothetical protein QW292_07015 [Candidatus Parvarchaeota archaeon]